MNEPAQQELDGTRATASVVLRCPVVHGATFDPMQENQVLDPHPWLEAARREAPVFYMPEYDCWCVTRYEDVLQVLKDTDTFSSRHVVNPRQMDGLDAQLPGGHPMAGGLVNTDPPEHRRLRKPAQKAFTPKMVDSYEVATRALAEEIIERVLPNGSMDLVSEFSRIFTGRVITAVVGAPVEKAEEFMAWSDNLLRSMVDAPPLSRQEESELVSEVVRFDGWLRGFIEDRRRSPQDDYVSLLLASGGDEPLSTDDVVRILANVIGAGLDTTSSLIGLTVFHLLESRERWERLLADRDLVPVAIEESLRFDDPIRGVRRDVLADAVIGGVEIPKGSEVYLNYTSAQRDESVFEEPDRFNFDRDDRDRHFAFGRWTHFCLGAPLARMEARVALQVLLERIPNLRLPDGGGPVPMPNRLGAFLLEFRLEWDPPSPSAGD